MSVEAVDLAYPFHGKWLVQNSPANRVPSHGTALFATTYAIDFVPVDDDGRTAPITFGSLVRPETADRFPGFGRPLLAPCSGLVVAVHDADPDHDAYRGWPSVRYALSQRQRVAAGWAALAGNRVLIECNSAVVALTHLQQGSVEIRVGDRVQAGDRIGRCGNSGNSTEPHLHFQAMDSSVIEQANAVPITFSGKLPRNGEIVDGG
jgi:hypothetical protein